MTDQVLVARIAVEEKRNDVRKAAIETLTDRVVLEKIAAASDDGKIRRFATVCSLADQSLRPRPPWRRRSVAS